MDWTNRLIGDDEVNPSTLNPNPMNWRVHPQHQRDALRGVLGEVGWVQRIIVNQRTGNVVDGHARVEEAIAEKQSSIPVTYVDLDENEERLVLATLDPLSAMAEQDDATLRQVIDMVNTEDDFLAGVLAGLRPEIVGPMEPDADAEEIPEIPEEPISQLGDVWQLGKHTVYCADATLMKWPHVDLLVTDPPYGVAYKGAPGFPRDAIKNDAMSADQMKKMWTQAFTQVRRSIREGGSYYVFCDAGPLFISMHQSINAAEWSVRQTLMWVKDTFVLGRNDYHYKHEPILYGWANNGSHYFVNDYTQSTVWEHARPKQSELHPTTKPWELIAKAINNSSTHGQTVCDPFLGSGTTVIAAEKTGRVCVGSELDPKYVDVIVRRWQDYTGEKATHAETGKAFDDVTL